MFSRPDQRQPDALRPIKITRNFTKHAPGSVLVCGGVTDGVAGVCRALFVRGQTRLAV